MEVHRVTDAAVIGLPGVDIGDSRIEAALAEIGEKLILERSPSGVECLMVSQDWIVVDNAEDVRDWELPCLCAVCQMAKDRAAETLERSPGSVIALGTLVYDQIG